MAFAYRLDEKAVLREAVTLPLQLVRSQHPPMDFAANGRDFSGGRWDLLALR